MARPRRAIDYDAVERLAHIQCTDEEIASVLDFTPEWFCKRKKLDKALVQALIKGREAGRESLRRMQYKAAENGNSTMLIWLGKQHLQQRDQPPDYEAGERTINAVTKLLDRLDADGAA